MNHGICYKYYENDLFLLQSSVVQYGSVFFGTELSLVGSWGQVECFGPTCSETEIINSIKNARLVERHCEENMYLLVLYYNVNTVLGIVIRL